jgi:hypothetical protein
MTWKRWCRLRSHKGLAYLVAQAMVARMEDVVIHGDVDFDRRIRSFTVRGLVEALDLWSFSRRDAEVFLGDCPLGCDFLDCGYGGFCGPSFCARRGNLVAFYFVNFVWI